MTRFRIFLVATFTAHYLSAVPFKIADVTVEAQGTNTIVTLNNKEYTVAQVTALLKTRSQQLMTADHISYAAAQRELGGKVSADLLEASRPVPFIHIIQGSNATASDLERLNAVLRQSGLTNIVLIRNVNTPVKKDADRGREPHR